MTLPELEQVVADFNAGNTVGPFDEPVTMYQCDKCGRYFATLPDANDCEWLCVVDETYEG